MANYQRKPLDPGIYFPKSFLYSTGHCWLHVEDLSATVGLTEFVFKPIFREYFFVQVPPEGQVLGKGDVCGALDALKIAVPILAPVSGEVREINPELERNPGIVMSSAYSMGWLWKMDLSEPIELRKLFRLDDYVRFLDGEDAYEIFERAESA